MAQSPEELYAELYDASVPDWPGEIDFYRELAAEATARGEAVLEVACGTGRVALRLAQDGARVVGFDLSPELLQVAASKSADMPNVRWEQGDMLSFDMGETFGLILIPGHSFQFMLTAEAQVACLACIRRHLVPGGTLVMHLDPPDVAWMGSLLGERGGAFGKAREIAQPGAGRRFRASNAWTYEPSTQTAAVITRWEELDAAGNVIATVKRGPMRLHSVFRLEIEHALARAGFELVALYGDFFRAPFGDASPSMVWVARNSA